MSRPCCPLSIAASVILLVGLLGGCSPKAILPTETSVTQSTSTSIPEQLFFDLNGIPEGIPPDWQILFAPFDRGSQQPEVLKAQAQQDHFIIENQGTLSGLYAIHTGTLPSSNLEIGMDVSPDGANPMGVFLVCRYSGSGWYQFRVSNGGSAIQRVEPKDGIYNSVNLVEGPGVFLDDGPHKLGAVCDGKQLSLLADGREILSKEADFLNGGSFGFGVESFSNPGGRKAFDNVSVQFLAEDIAAGPSRTLTEQVAALPATPMPAPVSAAAPTLRPTQIPQDQLVLYQTEFDDGDPTLADWKTFAYSFAENGFVTEGYDTYTVVGGYRIRTSDPNQGTNLRVFSIYDKELGTADVDISTRIKAGHIGLVCRYSEAGWYQFMIEPHEKWSIRLVQYDEARQLHFRIISSGLYRGRETMRAECKGNRLTLYGDDEKLASLYDSTFPTGKVGILGWSFDKPGEIGMIDSFTAQRAQSNEIALMDAAPTPDADEVLYSTDFAKVDDLSPYFIRYDAGVIELPGTPHLYGGPGSAESPHTIRYIQGFDPGPDVEISADIWDAVVARGLICRYNEDGWYQAHYESSQGSHVILVRMERNEQGQLTHTVLGSQDTPAGKQITLSLKCAGNQISVAVDGAQAIYAEDNAWQSGLSGLMYLNNLPASVKNAFTSYTIRKAQTLQPGDLIYDETFDTPEEIASGFNLNLEDTRLSIQNNVLLLAPEKDGLHPYTTQKYENGELRLDAEFLNASNIVLHCRSDSAAVIGAEIRSNGDWNLTLNYEEMLANGNSAGIKAGKNQFILKCVNSQITLIANGETLANVELPGYTPSVGTSGFDVFEGSQMKVNSLALKVFQSSSSLPAPARLNQVSLSTYQPGETIFAWKMEDMFYAGSGWWGRQGDAPWLWLSPFSFYDQRVRGDNKILMPSVKDIKVFTYRPDLYDLPIEISADVAITSKTGSVGLFCHATTEFLESERYEFLIQPDGRWTIRQNRSAWYAPSASNMTILAHGTAAPLRPEGNQIKATCDDNELILTVNGVELGRAEDDLYPEGAAGLFFDKFTEGSFTNLFIRRSQ